MRVPRRLLLLYAVLLGLEIGGGTLQVTGLITAIWLRPQRDVAFGLNSSFFFPLLALALLITVIILAIVGRKSPYEVKRPMYASLGIWIVIIIATGIYFIPNLQPAIIRGAQMPMTVADAAQRLATWTILDSVRQGFGIVAFVLAIKAYGAACRFEARQPME